MKKSFISFVILIGSFSWLNAQSLDSLFKNFTVNFNLEGYYSYDFNNPDSKNRPGFVYAHNRHNEFSVNHAILKTAYNDSKVRGNLGLLTGTYAQANYSTENAVFQKVFEANVGFHLSKNWWIDAGIFGSHIGFETAIGQDNWNLTRSMIADNSPYYMTGVKVAYEGAKLYAGLLILNGWQNIKDNNQNKAIGWQITWKPTAKILLNSSSFFGEGQNAVVADPLLVRYFHDFYVSFQITDKFAVATLFDIGWQENKDNPADTQTDTWSAGALLLKYAVSDKVTLAGRAEYYHDKNGVVIPTDTANGMNTQAFSLNLDVSPSLRVLWRVEGKLYTAKDEIFEKKDGVELTDNAFVLTTSLGFKF
jgi:hypothetical protein